MAGSTGSEQTQGTPLVEPGPALSPERLTRYSRQLLLPGFGESAQRRLAAARVLVVGAGGLGSATVPYLAAAGVGTIGIVDEDAVELSNLHRQVAHALADVGREKTGSLAAAVAAIDPGTRVERHDLRLDSTNVMDILAGYDLVLDGSDNFATRYLTSDAAAIASKPLVWGAIFRYAGQASVSYAGHGPTYRDLFPVPPEPGEVLSCAAGGVLPSLCAAIGSIMVTETIKLITGIGRPLIGRVISYDALSGSFREIPYRSIPDAPPVTELIDYEAFCGVAARPEAAGNPASIDVHELARRRRAGEPLQLVDVREPFEAAIASIDGSEPIPLRLLPQSVGRLRRDVPIVVYCHHGPRAERARDIMREHGLGEVAVLAGGIDAYAALIEPSMARY